MRHESLAACIMSLTYIKNNSGPNDPKIEPWGTPQDTDAGREKLFPQLTGKDLLKRLVLNWLAVCFKKPTVSNFFSITSWSIVSQSFLKFCHSKNKGKNP